MELDELKAAWQELDRKTQWIATQIERQEMRRIEAKTIGFVRLCVFEIIVGVIAVLLVGTFLVNGPRVAEFLVPALLLHIAAILTIASPTWQLATLKGTDYSRPVVEIQQRLARIRAVRIRFTQAILLASPLLWALLTIVVLDGLSGFEVHRAFGEAYIAANVLFGIAAIPLLYWLARTLRRRFKGSSVMIGLMDDLGGRSLSSVLRELEEISRFRSEA